MSHHPTFAVPDAQLVPVHDYPAHLCPIPMSRMFLIKKRLQDYRQEMGDSAQTYDASQGDGGKSLPGVPGDLLDRAYALQREHGTGYDSPHGTPRFWQAVAENYWQFAPETGWGPQNVAAVQGGRDGLLKAYGAMCTLGTGRIGDVIMTSAVPWISYNWGPYAVGMNLLRAPGDPADGWRITPQGIAESVAFCDQHDGRRIAGLIITSPDNPTGRTLSLEDQIALAHAAFEQGIPYVMFDWIYHWVTSGQPHDINVVLRAFSPEERGRLIFLDGITKSLGASNIRNAHVLAGEPVIKFITSRASHGVLPSFYSQAVAIAAYEMGFAKACAPIVEPTAQSRATLNQFLSQHEFDYVIGDGYYAFINCEKWIAAGGLGDSEALGQYLAQKHGLAVVPGANFSPAGAQWIRFSYALPPERTRKAAERLLEGLNALL